MKNYEEVKAWIDKKIEEYDEKEDFNQLMEDVEYDKDLQKEGGFEFIEQQGGEGEGENYFIVIHFTEPDIYVKFSGRYTSYDGTEWDDDFEQVTPKKKTITVYE